MIDDDNRVLLGHGRIDAARGRSDLDVVRLSDLSEAQRQAFVVAERKCAVMVANEETSKRELATLCARAPSLQSAVEKPTYLDLLIQVVRGGRIGASSAQPPEDRLDDDATPAETEADATSDGAVDYQVGYGKPPVHSQFKKGQSGNPAGRPKRVHDLILEQALQLVPVTLENGETVQMPAVQAVLHAQRAHALAGNGASQRAYLKAVQVSDAERMAEDRRQEKRKRKREKEEELSHPVSDLDLARWILSILEGGREELMAGKDADLNAPHNGGDGGPPAAKVSDGAAVIPTCDGPPDAKSSREEGGVHASNGAPSNSPAGLDRATAGSSDGEAPPKVVGMKK